MKPNLRQQPAARAARGGLSMRAVALLVLGAAALLGGGAGYLYFREHFTTPASTEPDPPNVSYKKWEKTSNLYVKIEPTPWERRLGRNLHRVAYQAATNLVCQTLARPETARFQPYSQAKITGVDWRFLVKCDYTAVNKSGEFHQYDFRAFLKRDTNEVWTLEYLDKDKEDGTKKSAKPKSSE
ncbi:MAG: hypothetical protein N3J91_15520 [Verrucomicrobiae bacterium]|nr:hypothetical protein [Verrucomicrobiae bacterium]